MKKFIIIGSIIVLCSLFPLKSFAAETNNNLTTITVGASDDGSGSLMYAIDSDDPNAFGSSNEFVVESGTSHTVYVKDAAGNISSQLITAPIEKVGIEVTIGQDGTDSAVASASAGAAAGEAAEKGGGTINEKTITDGSSESEKIFYTITTKNENVFYMVIDNTRSQDNVYLLNQVTEEDLLSLVNGADAKKKDNGIFSGEDSTLSNVSDVSDDKKTNETKETNNKSTLPITMFAILLMGGGFYYMKFYKPKKEAELDLRDAKDMDEFEAEEDEEEEDDELYFEEEAQEEKEKLLESIISEEDYDSTEDDEADEESENDEPEREVEE